MKKVRSFIYMLNGRGPRTDPCGTPDVTSSQELYALTNSYKFCSR